MSPLVAGEHRGDLQNAIKHASSLAFIKHGIWAQSREWIPPRFVKSTDSSQLSVVIMSAATPPLLPLSSSQTGL